MHAFHLRIKTVLVSHATAVYESAALAVSCIIVPFVHVILARAPVRLHVTYIWGYQASNG